MAIASGATYRASTSEVLIQRAGTATLQKFPQSPTVAVMPGDLVRVPESNFFRLNEIQPTFVSIPLSGTDHTI
jgi:hypothetical protein